MYTEFNKKEANERLRVIQTLIDDFLDANPPMLVDTANIITALQEIALGTDNLIEGEKQVKGLEHVLISCDASIKKNPGGPSSVGCVLEVPGKKPMDICRRTRSTTNNLAEYDAVYFGLTSFINLNNNPRMKIEIRSDSKLVIDQLNGDMNCADEKLKEKKAGILELVGTIPVPVEFRWMPRNSTQGLKRANFLAQDLLQVPRH